MASYGTSGGTAAYCKQLTPALDWSETTSPASASVTRWLEQGYAKINMALAQAGYSTPVADTADAYEELQAINDLYAAAQAETAWNVSRGEAEEETRGARYNTEWRKRLKELLEGDLTLAGLSLSSTARPRRRIRVAVLRREDGYSEYSEDNE